MKAIGAGARIALLPPSFILIALFSMNIAPLLQSRNFISPCHYSTFDCILGWNDLQLMLCYSGGIGISSSEWDVIRGRRSHVASSLRMFETSVGNTPPFKLS